jgi:hypothetical protein
MYNNSMAPAEPSPPAAALLRRFRWRRLLQFSLRTLLILTAVVAALLAILVTPCVERHTAIRAIDAAGGNVGWIGVYKDGYQPPRGFAAWREAIWPSVDCVGFERQIEEDVWLQVVKLQSIEELTFMNKQSKADCWRFVNLLPRLKWLAVTEVNDALFPHLRNNTSIERLDVDGADVTGKGIDALATIVTLRELSLGDTSVGDEALRFIGKIRGLEQLRLFRTRITDAGIKHLISLRQLKVLDLDETDLTDECLKDLNRITSLEELHIDGCLRMTFNRFAELKDLKNLKLLHVSGYVMGSPDTPDLQAMFPNCQIKGRVILDLRSLGTPEGPEWEWPPEGSRNPQGKDKQGKGSAPAPVTQ